MKVINNRISFFRLGIHDNFAVENHNTSVKIYRAKS